jgi:hypothetical protein
LRSIVGGIRMCHEWWLRRRLGEGEVSRRPWEEFEHTRPLSDARVVDEQPDVTLEKREPMPLAAQH